MTAEAWAIGEDGLRWVSTGSVEKELERAKSDTRMRTRLRFPPDRSWWLFESKAETERAYASWK